MDEHDDFDAAHSLIASFDSLELIKFCLEIEKPIFSGDVVQSVGQLLELLRLQ